jgi:hypothetical protein
MTTRLLAPAALLLLVAVACGDDERPARAASDPSTGPSTTGTPGDDPTAAVPAFPRGTGRQSSDGSGEWDLVLTDVRVDERDGLDRIVLEFSGTGAPGWTVGYVDEAVLDGSGEAVRLGGDAILDLYASGTTWPAPDYYSGPARLGSGTGGGAPDVYVAGTFEGYTQVLAGIDGEPTPFRVFALTDPPRLVVDVVDAVDDGAG